MFFMFNNLTGYLGLPASNPLTRNNAFYKHKCTSNLEVYLANVGASYTSSRTYSEYIMRTRQLHLTENLSSEELILREAIFEIIFSEKIYIDASFICKVI